MKLYLLKFSRTNFTLKPIVKQSADVVFESDKDLGDGNPYHSEVSEDAWQAMREQNPHWDNPEFPVKGVGGWSSVMPDGDIIELNTKVTIELGKPGEGKPRLCEIFEYDGRSYRVAAFYKQSQQPESTDKTSNFLNFLIAKTEQERKENNQILIIQCTREEAEFVSGTGVCGVILPLELAKITGRVNWDDLTIQRERESYRPYNDTPNVITQHWLTEDEA